MIVTTRELAMDPGRVISSRVRPIPVWVPIVGFAVATALLLIAGQAGLARLVFPAGAVVVAAWLYVRGPGPYLAFAWLLWHFSPGIRRIVDYQLGGLDPANPISLTPLLVSALAVFGVLRRLPELWSTRYAPWLVALGCVLYGFLVGVLRLGVMPATHALITWAVPVVLGLYHVVQWRRYPEMREATRIAFTIGAVVMAAYGIAQFIDPPQWDRLWMQSSGMFSVGRAFPYEVRVFGLMNSPHSFATILLAGFFIALLVGGKGRLVVLGLVAVALLLSLVRSVWIAGAIGFLVLMFSIPRRMVRRVALTGLLAAAVVLLAPFTAPPQIRDPTLEIIGGRFRTFTSLGRDVSFQERASFLDNISDVVAENPWGYGLGSTGMSSLLSGAGKGIRDFDNGVFAVLYGLGWFAGTGLLIAAVAAVAGTFDRRKRTQDLMAKIARAIAVSVLLLILGANILEGPTAAILWSFVGLAVAANRYETGVKAAVR